jgi:ribosome-binding factor A
MDVGVILHDEMRDPRVRNVTCTRVDLTKDLRFAKLYVSVLGDQKSRKEALSALEHATSFVRRRLARQLGLRAAPEIRFIYDPSIEYSIRLEELIAESKSRSPSDEVEAGMETDAEEDKADG